MIEVQNLYKQYGKLEALKGISFNVKKGEILGLLGPNGAGKTTAMRIITGFLPATSGDVKIADFDIMKNSLDARKLIGYLPERVPLYEDLLVSESLKFQAEIKGVPKKEIKSAIDKVLDECGIKDVENKLIRTLSKGYRQRVGLAQALINDPKILILDEPTIGLDPKQIIEIRELIKGFAGKRTVILSSHILPEVSIICNRIAIIHKGELIALDTQKKLARKALGGPSLRIAVKGPVGKVKTSLLEMKEIKDVDVLAAKPGPINDYLLTLDDSDKARAQISSLIIKNKWQLLKMEDISEGLEDIFINLVNKYERSKK